MSYLTIGYTEYMVRAGEGRGRTADIEIRRRAVDGGLLVDTIAQKQELTVTITGEVEAGRFFTPEEADDLIAEIRSGAVELGGIAGSFTGRARDIGWTDGQSWEGGSVSVYRWVTATFEEV